MKLLPALSQRFRGVGIARNALTRRVQSCLRQSTSATVDHYLPAQLNEQNVAIREPYVILHNWLTTALKKAPECKPRMACLATVDTTGQPVTRLTSIDQINAAGITFYTALGSRQAGEIRSNPHVSLQFHWPSLQRSVHVAGMARPLNTLQAQRQFAKYSRELQLQPCNQRTTRQWLVAGRLHEMILRLLNKMHLTQKRVQPVPPNWGGLLLQPNLYEFFESCEQLTSGQCLRFRRCLTLPRGMRKRTVNADPSDWVFDSSTNLDEDI